MGSRSRATISAQKGRRISSTQTADTITSMPKIMKMPWYVPVRSKTRPAMIGKATPKGIWDIIASPRIVEKRADPK